MSPKRRNQAAKLQSAQPIKPPSLFDRLNEFLVSAKSKPLWVLGGTLALACIGFAWAFFGNYAEQRANFDEEGVKFHRALSAGQEILKTMGRVEDALRATRDVLANYKAAFGGKSVGEPLDKSLLEKGKALARTAYDANGVAKANLQSAQYPDADLNTAASALRDDLDTQQKRVEVFFKFYVAALSDNADSFSAALEPLKKTLDDAHAVEESLANRVIHFMDNANHFHDLTQIEVEKASGQIKWFYGKEALAWAAVAYALFFGLAGIWAFYRSR